MVLFWPELHQPLTCSATLLCCSSYHPRHISCLPRIDRGREAWTQLVSYVTCIGLLKDARIGPLRFQAVFCSALHSSSRHRIDLCRPREKGQQS